MAHKSLANRWTVSLDYFFNFLRRHLSRHRFFSTFRQLIHFGPWRIFPKFLIRHLNPPVLASTENRNSLVNVSNVYSVAEEIHLNSVALAGVLPSSLLRRFKSITDILPIDQYQLMHHIDKDVLAISENPVVLNVLREYFHSEPVLLESTLMITGSKGKRRIDSQNEFHFDYAGWESLNVFVYLTDVTESSSYHSVIKGSHRRHCIRDILRGSITQEEAQLRFGSSIKIILGEAGTVFFENTEAFHRRNYSGTRRVMLNLLFSSHRNFLSHGRCSQADIEKRARVYNEYRTKAGL